MRHIGWLMVVVMLVITASAVLAADGVEKDTLGVVVRGIASTPRGIDFWGFNSREEGESSEIALPQGCTLRIALDPVQSDAMKSFQLFIGWNGNITRGQDGKPCPVEGWQDVMPRLGPNSLVVYGVYKDANRKSVPFVTIPILGWDLGHKVAKMDQKSAEWLGVAIDGYDGPLDAKPMAAFTRAMNSSGRPMVDLLSEQPATVTPICEVPAPQRINELKRLRDVAQSELSCLQRRVNNVNGDLMDHERETGKQFNEAGSWLSELTISITAANAYLAGLDKSLDTYQANAEATKEKTIQTASNLTDHETEAANQFKNVWEKLRELVTFTESATKRIDTLTSDLQTMRNDLGRTMARVDTNSQGIANAETRLTNIEQTLARALPPKPFRVQWVTGSDQQWGGKVYLLCSDGKQYVIPSGSAEWTNPNGSPLQFSWRLNQRQCWNPVSTVVQAGQLYSIQIPNDGGAK